MGALQQTFVLKVRDVLMHRRERVQAKTLGNLLVGRRVPMLCREGREEINDFFLPSRDSHTTIVANKKRSASA